MVCVLRCATTPTAPVCTLHATQVSGAACGTEPNIDSSAQRSQAKVSLPIGRAETEHVTHPVLWARDVRLQSLARAVSSSVACLSPCVGYVYSCVDG